MSFLQSRRGRVGCALGALLIVGLAMASCSEGAGNQALGSDEPMNDGQGEGYGSELLDRKRFTAVGPAPVYCVGLLWEMPAFGGGSPNRWLDAYTSRNGNVVTRTWQSDTTQWWCFTSYGNATYTIQHRSFQGQFLDAHTSSANDYRAVLRDAQTLEDGSPDPSQLWRQFGSHLIQVSTGRHLDGYSDALHDYQVVTRSQQATADSGWSSGVDSDSSQVWTITTAGPLPPPVSPCPGAPCPPF